MPGYRSTWCYGNEWTRSVCALHTGWIQKTHYGWNPVEIVFYFDFMVTSIGGRPKPEFASCRGGWDKRSCPRSAMEIHSVAGGWPYNLSIERRTLYHRTITLDYNEALFWQQWSVRISAGSCQDLRNWNLLQSGQALGIMTVAGKFSNADAIFVGVRSCCL